MTEYNDISGLNNIIELQENSTIKKWIKIIPIEKTVIFNEYNRKDDFILVANVILDNEINKKNIKKRKTLFKFVPQITNKEFNEKIEWLYLFVINGRIVKIGGTRTGLNGRISSYLCGHHVKERNKSGDCSKTNGFIYNTFEFYLELGCEIKMYGYKIPKKELTIKIFDIETTIIAQTYHAYESKYIEDFQKEYKYYPFLCDNCDPVYKN
jgi:hypothetical protein